MVGPIAGPILMACKGGDQWPILARQEFQNPIYLKAHNYLLARPRKLRASRVRYWRGPTSWATMDRRACWRVYIAHANTLGLLFVDYDL